MIECYLVEGNQNPDNGEPQVYGLSITGWEDTETILRQLASAVKTHRG